jgi:hypothetical protein
MTQLKKRKEGWEWWLDAHNPTYAGGRGRRIAIQGWHRLKHEILFEK